MTGFAPLFSAAEIRTVETDAVRLLAEVGLQCDHAATLERLRAAGAKVAGGRVLLDAGRVEGFFADRKHRLAADLRAAEARPGSGDFTMGGQWNCLELCDPATNLPKPATTSEAVSMARLSEALGAKGGPIPVAPSDVDPAVRTLVCERIALTHTAGLGSWLTATDPIVLAALTDMYDVAGRRYTVGLEGLISPLKLNGRVLDLYFALAENPRLDLGIMGGIPVLGTSAPFSFPAAMSLALAEAIALDFVMSTLSNGRHTVFNLRLDVFDMRHSNLLFGSPEWCLMSQAVREVHEGIFGFAGSGGCFRSNGKRVDAQTLLERSNSFLWQVMLGSRRFGSVGQTCLDEVYSPVLAVLDGELLRYGKRLAGGLPPSLRDGDCDVVELVREGLEDGFLATDLTAERFREFQDLERLATAESLGSWRAGGQVGLEERAAARAAELIAGHTFSLAPDQTREIESICQRTCRVLT